MPAAGAVVGTSLMVLLVELARSGALEQYKELLAPLIGWGPGLLIVAGFLWLAHSYMPPFLESQRATATALQKLADTVEHSSDSQHDLVLAIAGELRQAGTTEAPGGGVAGPSGGKELRGKCRSQGTGSHCVAAMRSAPDGRLARNATFGTDYLCPDESNGRFLVALGMTVMGSEGGE